MEFVIFYDAVDGLLTLIIVNLGGKPATIQITIEGEFNFRSKKECQELTILRPGIFIIRHKSNLSSLVKQTYFTPIKCMRLHSTSEKNFSLSQQIRSLLPYWAKGIFLSKIYRNNRLHVIREEPYYNFSIKDCNSS